MMSKLKIETEDNDKGSMLKIELPIDSYKICGCEINGIDIWPKDIGVTYIALQISSDKEKPILTIKGYPLPPK
ncbi:MAG: hypothetical protein IJU37_11865 [Desulfovibrio sp.]|nr:hypothetical protein [Desulfovibrio sp.]